MCGIAGILRFDDQPIESEKLDRIRASLAHRGPDGHGMMHNPQCALLHTRLSVIDLLSGDQPMHVEAAGDHPGLSLIFNGEIYNHRRLRRQLERLGHRFASDHSDTEVLMFGYREWGTELPKHLRGMFAFVVYEHETQRLFLARDRVGEKPLYYHRSAEQFTFASLLGPMLRGLGHAPPIDPHALGHFLTFGYTDTQSIYQGVQELYPGHWMRIDRTGRIEYERYWQQPPLSRSSTSLGAAAACEEVLSEAVRSQLESDVALGCFLSGGIDSSLIAAMAQRELGDRRLRTFSVAMPQERYDESQYAQRVAQHLGTEHHELHVEPDLEKDLTRLIGIVGEPFADSSILPTYWLAKAARAQVTVALSGDGGDELFGGYDRYRALRMVQRYGWALRHMPMGLLAAGEQKKLTSRLRRLLRAARAESPAEQYLDMIRLFSPQQIGELGLAAANAFSTPPGWSDEMDPAEAARQWDFRNYLPYDLLRKSDRAAMAVALEMRCPMLATDVSDLAGHLPLHVLMPGGQPKGLLRQVAAKYLPASIVHRRKMGFAIPLGSWLRGPLQSWLRYQLLETSSLAELGIRYDPVRQMIEQHHAAKVDHTHRLFALLSLSLWRKWLNGI